MLSNIENQQHLRHSQPPCAHWLELDASQVCMIYALAVRCDVPCRVARRGAACVFPCLRPLLLRSFSRAASRRGLQSRFLRGRRHWFPGKTFTMKLDFEKRDIVLVSRDWWWYSTPGQIVRWTGLGVIVSLALLWFIGGYVHARLRVKSGKEPLAYHRVRKTSRSQHWC